MAADPGTARRGLGRSAAIVRARKPGSNAAISRMTAETRRRGARACSAPRGSPAHELLAALERPVLVLDRDHVVVADHVERRDE